MLRTDYRDNMLAIEVKDHSLYWGTPDFGPYLQHMSEATFGALYEQVREVFWMDAQVIAHDFGYSEVYSAGRSDGWLATEGALDDAKFGRYVEAISDLMDASRTYLLALVREAATDESNIVRGES